MEITLAHPLVQLIDRAVELANEREFPFRSHLGGSMIGRQCEREIWYSFRWAKRPEHKGRILRLFGRGHLEEFRFVKYLLCVGAEVRAYSERLVYHDASDSYSTLEWESDVDEQLTDVTNDAAHVARAEAQGVRLKQWRIIDADGHFGGSLDGIASNVPGLDGDVLLEFKTHNAKSFAKLREDKVRLAKPEHYAQMQVYMHKRQLGVALYMAVNKNDDDLYCEVVPYDQAAAVEAIEKAKRIIAAKQPPERIGKTASWFGCKFCDYKATCHYGEPTMRNCRSCQFSEPVADGKWRCNRWSVMIPNDEAMLAGCDAFKQITD